MNGDVVGFSAVIRGVRAHRAPLTMAPPETGNRRGGGASATGLWKSEVASEVPLEGLLGGR